MAVLIIPIGQACGPVFAGGGGEHEKPILVEVRVGEIVNGLDDDEFRMWSIAHGDPERVAARKWTRRELLNDARKAAVGKPERLLDELLEAGLLAQLEIGDDGAVDPAGAVVFAAAHRLFPLGVGLGNTPEDPHMYGIGYPGEARLEVSRHPYHLWLFGPVYASIWSACETLAADLQNSGETDEELLEPAALLDGFMSVLPSLVATGCSFLDRADI